MNGHPLVAMLLSNPYNPDDRVRNEALALKEAGYKVFIIAWDRDGSHPLNENAEGLEVRRILLHAGYEQGLKQGFAFLRMWSQMMGELRRLKPDIVHCHDFDTYPAGLGYKFSRKKVRLVFDAHENYAVMMKVFISNSLGSLIRLLESVSVHFADAVIGPCKATVDYYVQKRAKKGAVVGNWKDPKNYQFSIETLERKRQELGIGNRLVITYIGALSAERYILPLIQAVKERPSFFLIVGGSGVQDDAIRQAIQGVENVYFPGYIHPDEVPLFTALSDIIYYGYQPNHPYGPFNAPNKLYEALAAGKAMLASDLGGELSTVVRSLQCGLLLTELTPTSIGDALDHLSVDGSRRDMQEQAKSAGIDLYNWNIARQRLLEVYAGLCN